MRSIFLLTSILLVPGAAVAGTPLQCGLPSVGLLQRAAADAAVVPSPAFGQSAPSATQSARTDTAIQAQKPPGQDSATLANLSPSVIRSIPVLEHIADSGAQIEDLGTSHGLQTVLARKGGQFMMLEVTDRKSVV